MKHIGNTIYCNSCNKQKLLFESQKKADNFILFNGEDYYNKTGKILVRSYYCQFCGGWHVTSNPSITFGERMDSIDKQAFESIETIWAGQLQERDERRKESMEQQKVAKDKRIEWEKNHPTSGQDYLKAKQLLCNAFQAVEDGDISRCQTLLNKAEKFMSTVYPGKKLKALQNKMSFIKERISGTNNP